MTTFARHALADFERFGAERFRNVAQWRVAGRAAAVGRGILDLQRVADLFGARRGEGGKRPLRVEILQQPDQILVLVLPAAPMAAGTAARGRAEKSGSNATWKELRRGGSNRENSQNRGDGGDANGGQRGTK